MIGRQAPRSFPSFELQGRRQSLERLGRGFTGCKAELAGGRVSAVWLRGAGDEDIWLVTVDQRDVQPLFEVFTLRIESVDELRRRLRDWMPPRFTPDLPPPLRRLLTTRPAEPAAPDDFELWSFPVSQVEVLRRVEFVVSGGHDLPVIGEHPNEQSAVRPGQVPDEASASCEVAAGLLFTGAAGERLLIGVDRMPLDIVLSREDGVIDTYLASCVRIGLASYLVRA